MPVFVLDCCRKCQHSVKQRPFSISRFLCCGNLGPAQLGDLLRVSHWLLCEGARAGVSRLRLVWGKVSCQAHMVVGSIHTLAGYQIGCLGSLLAVRWSSVSGPCDGGFSVPWLISSKPARKSQSRGSLSKMEVVISHNSAEVTSHPLCCVLLIRVSHRPCPHSRGHRA